MIKIDHFQQVEVIERSIKTLADTLFNTYQYLCKN